MPSSACVNLPTIQLQMSFAYHALLYILQERERSANLFKLPLLSKKEVQRADKDVKFVQVKIFLDRHVQCLSPTVS